MDIFLDNTGVHNLLNIFENEKYLTRNDVVNLFHFAEHIMFSDALTVSIYEPEEQIEITNRVVKNLQLLGLFKANEQDKCLLETIDFNWDEYVKSSEKCVPKIIQELQILDESKILKFFKMAGSDALPKNVENLPILKWIKKDWSKKERALYIEECYVQKAFGVFDYIIADNEIIYNLIKDLTKNIKENENLKKIAIYITVFLRIHINQSVATYSKIGGLYSPAPKRAKIMQTNDYYLDGEIFDSNFNKLLFRHHVSHKIEKYLQKNRNGFKSRLMDEIAKEETLPLPIYALSILKNHRNRINSPLKLLESAYELRLYNEQVMEIRKWLNKWENLYPTNFTDEKKEWRDELIKIENFYNLKDISIKNLLISIFRKTKIKIEPDGFPSFGLDDSYEPAIGLISKVGSKIKNRKRNTFLTILSDCMESEDMGEYINDILNIAILKD